MLVSATTVGAETLAGDDFLKSLEGTYIELFSLQTCLETEYDDLWHSEAAKFVGEDCADDAVSQLVGACTGSVIGDDAVAAYAENGTPRFCCSFTQSVAKISFDGSRISGVDVQGSEVFGHNYHFVGNDADGNYIFESDDDNVDEFRYFWMRPDNPAATYHIEFRYGSDSEQLARLMSGKYAFWMASGVREGHTDEYRNSIILFIGENLGREE